MGFSGGGSNITKAHTHDSTIVQDGGSLAANVTQFGLTAGSILYSDGSNIQELSLGLATEQLAVNAGANAPEWVTAAAGGGGQVELLNATVLASDTNTVTITPGAAWTEEDYAAILIVITTAPSAGGGVITLQINNDGSASYDSDGFYITGGAQTIIDDGGGNEWKICANQTANEPANIQTIIQMGDTDFSDNRGHAQTTTAQSNLLYSVAHSKASSVTEIDDLYFENHSGDFLAQSKFTVFGFKRA